MTSDDRGDNDDRIRALLTPEPDPSDLDDIDRAVLTVAAEAARAGRGNDEPGGYVFLRPDGALDCPVIFGTPGSVDRGALWNAAGHWVIAGWHGHGPVPRSDPYYNPVNFHPSPGDRHAFTIANRQLREAGRLRADDALREYLITPDGGIRCYDDPVTAPFAWRAVAGSGFYRW